uniref:putative nuclease HARBI1 n=1 Tax=Pristiophorus japonicus TaxID=55135 RepID=UPI00398F43E6
MRRVIRRRSRPYPPRNLSAKRSYLDLTERLCGRRLRFKKEVLNEIYQLIKADLQPSSTYITALSVEEKVTAALSFYASGSFQSSAVDICCISQHAAHTSIHQVNDALYAHRMDFIKFPMTTEAQSERVLGFCMHRRLPKDSGCYGLYPYCNESTITEAYQNRKGFHSLNMQLVCDHLQRIMAVNANFSGSIHDAHISHESTVSDLLKSQPQGKWWLLGDKEYGLATWLLTPIRNPWTQAEQRYKKSHIVTRNIIEKTIGELKQSC